MSVDKETGIWDLKTAATNHRYDFLLAAAIVTYFSPKVGIGKDRLDFPKKILDVGCGDGRYCSIFEACGCPNVIGLEGTPDIMNLGIFDNIIEVDLTKSPLERVKDKYDLVVCLEVGEHIPAKHEQTFIDNLCNFTRQHLVMSWALPGRAGTGHVNVRPSEYIVNEIARRGFKQDKDMTELLRDKAYFNWFKKSLLVFERRKNDESRDCNQR